MRIQRTMATFFMAASVVVLATAPADAGPRGWINQAIESQKSPSAPAEKPAAKSPAAKAQSTARGSGDRGGSEKAAPKTGGGGFQIASSTGGGGMDEMALNGTRGLSSQSVDARGTGDPQNGASPQR